MGLVKTRLLRLCGGYYAIVVFHHWPYLLVCRYVKSKAFLLPFASGRYYVLFHHYERGAARYLPTSVEQLFGKEYDYRSGKVAPDGVGGRSSRVVAAIHSCRSAGIHGAEGASRRVVATENAQRR